MSDVLRELSRVQAVRPTCHWWRCPRVFAWFRVLMMVSLGKRPASAGLLSRRGEYLLLQHEGLGSDKNLTDSAWHGRHQRRPCSTGTMTRSPPQPRFHRRFLSSRTLGVSRCQRPQRSVGFWQSAAHPCSAQNPLPNRRKRCFSALTHTPERETLMGALQSSPDRPRPLRHRRCICRVVTCPPVRPCRQRQSPPSATGHPIGG
jgi:hypothetical protein